MGQAVSDGEVDDELLDEIESDEPSDVAVQSLERTVERFNYVASLLSALAEIVRDEGDHSGAALLLAFSQDMAQHEARTL